MFGAHLTHVDKKDFFSRVNIHQGWLVRDIGKDGRVPGVQDRKMAT